MLEVAAALTLTLGWLYNGRHFVSAEGADNINMSSIAPIYPMQVVGYGDERARSTWPISWINTAARWSATAAAAPVSPGQLSKCVRFFGFCSVVLVHHIA